MPFNDNIPGQINRWQMRAIETIAAAVPKNGHMVEVGSLFGASSWAWAKSVDPSVTVHCVDPWENNKGVQPLEERHGIKYSLEQFQIFVADCDNIQAHKGYSPNDFDGWDKQIDLYYEDAVHTDPIIIAEFGFLGRTSQEKRHHVWRRLPRSVSRCSKWSTPQSR